MSRVLEMVLGVGPWTTVGLVVALGFFVVVVGSAVPRLLVFASLGCYSALMVNRSFIAIPGIIDLRLLAVGLAFYLVLVRGRPPKLSALRKGAFPAALLFYVFGFVTVGTAVDRDAAWDALLAGVLCVLFVWLLVSAAEPDEIRSSIHGLSGLILIGSIVFVLVDPGSAKVHGRWAGLVTNANTLGVFSTLFLLTARPARALYSLPATVIGLIGSASRSSAFAGGLIAGPRVVERLGQRVRRIVLAVALVSAAPIVHAVFFSAGDATGSASGEHGGSLTRTGNSRADFWAEGWDLFVAHPATGVGIGNEPSLLSSSVLSPLVQVGAAGLIPLGMIAVLALRRAGTERTVYRPMFAFFLVHGIFEMWLFAGGSIIFAIFLIAAYDPERQRDRPAPENDRDDDVMAWSPNSASRWARTSTA